MNYTEKALVLFKKKFHCSQAVFAAFAEEIGISEESALKIGSCFGGGLCNNGQVCGACSGALMIIGMKFGHCKSDDVKRKAKVTQLGNKFLELFKEKHGSYICKDLLKCDLATQEGKEYAIKNNLFTEFCPQMVATATELTEQLLSE